MSEANEREEDEAGRASVHQRHLARMSSADRPRRYYLTRRISTFDGYVLLSHVLNLSDIVQSLINSEIAEINNKIKALDSIHETLEQDLLKLHEDELELDDERKG
jgi:hypothetical protein